MKIVLDTNVPVSGIFFSGPPAAMLQAWRRGRIRLVVSSGSPQGNLPQGIFPVIHGRLRIRGLTTG